MWPDQQETPDLVTFTEEILNGKTAIFVQCVSRAIDAICWRLCFFFFQSSFEANEMLCLLNKFVLLTNQKQPLKYVR